VQKIIMSNILIRISVFSLIFLTTACGSVKNQPQRPMETYQQAVELPPSVSTVSIPVRLKAADIERALNNKMNGVIYDDSNLDDDGMMMKATKSQNITIRLEGLQMTYRVPLKLWVFKKIIGSRGIESEGEIALTFKTTLNIKPDWSVEPRTELASYDWLRNMVVKTGLGNIDVKYIANIIIDRSKSTLSGAIDQQLKNQLQIKTNLDEAWKMMQNPVSMNSSYGTWWIKLTPQRVAMTPLRSTGNAIESVITAESFVEVVAGNQQPAFRPNTVLPAFQLNNSVISNDFNVNLTTDISIKEAEQMAKNFVKGQTFNPGGKTIRVEDIQMFGQNDKIVVNTKFSGDYTGSLYLIGRPIFNPKKNTIEMEDLDYDLETKSFLMRSATWLFDKTILKKIKESCVFPLDENVKYFKTMMNDQLKNYKFNNNVSLNGSVDDIKVEKILLTQGNIKAYISSKGKLLLDVNGLDTF
jgi:Domain of unknown function (DUF4403)